MSACIQLFDLGKSLDSSTFFFNPKLTMPPSGQNDLLPFIRPGDGYK